MSSMSNKSNAEIQTPDELYSVLQSNSDDLSVICFYYSFCKPCLDVLPSVKRLQQQDPKVKWIHVDLGEHNLKNLGHEQFEACILTYMCTCGGQGNLPPKDKLLTKIGLRHKM